MSQDVITGGEAVLAKLKDLAEQVCDVFIGKANKMEMRIVLAALIKAIDDERAEREHSL